MTIKDLIINECANYSNGKCLIKDRLCPLIHGGVYNGYKIPAEDFSCTYFETHVLPADKTLEAIYYGKETAPVKMVDKNCKGCGKAFKSTSNKALYCGDICRKSANRKSHRKYNRKRVKNEK
jgi:hypothetical protein